MGFEFAKYREGVYRVNFCSNFVSIISWSLTVVVNNIKTRMLHAESVFVSAYGYYTATIVYEYVYRSESIRGVIRPAQSTRIRYLPILLFSIFESLKWEEYI